MLVNKFSGTISATIAATSGPIAKDSRMCLGVPMRIVEIEGYVARCEARGVERTVNLFLMQHETLGVGDMVMVHVGNAIQKISDDEAKSVWDAYDEILELEGKAAQRA